MKIYSSLMIRIICFIVVNATVFADEIQEEKKERTWDFLTASYLWFAEQEGTISTRAGLPPADIEINSYDDVAENLNGTI